MNLVFNKVPLISPVEPIQSLEDANQFIDDFTHFWDLQSFRDSLAQEIMYGLTSNFKVKEFIEKRHVSLDSLMSLRLLECLTYRLASFVDDMKAASIEKIPPLVFIQYYVDSDPETMRPVTVSCRIKEDGAILKQDYDFFTNLLNDDLGYRDTCTKNNPFRGLKKVVGFKTKEIELNLKNFDSIQHSLFHSISDQEFLMLKKTLEIENSFSANTIAPKKSQGRF